MIVRLTAPILIWCYWHPSCSNNWIFKTKTNWTKRTASILAIALYVQPSMLDTRYDGLQKDSTTPVSHPTYWIGKLLDPRGQEPISIQYIMLKMRSLKREMSPCFWEKPHGQWKTKTYANKLRGREKENQLKGLRDSAYSLKNNDLKIRTLNWHTHIYIFVLIKSSLSLTVLNNQRKRQREYINSKLKAKLNTAPTPTGSLQLHLYLITMKSFDYQSHQLFKKCVLQSLLVYSTMLYEYTFKYFTTLIKI